MVFVARIGCRVLLGVFGSGSSLEATWAVKITERQGESRNAKLLRQAGILTSVGVLLWLLLAGPAWLAAGRDGLAGLSVSAALCLLSGIPVLLVVGWFSDAQSMLPILGSMVRLVIVFCGCLVVVEVVPTWGFREFFIWLILYYFVLLVVETAFILQSLKSNSNRDKSGTSVSA